MYTEYGGLPDEPNGSSSFEQVKVDEPAAAFLHGNAETMSTVQPPSRLRRILPTYWRVAGLRWHPFSSPAADVPLHYTDYHVPAVSAF